MMTKDFEKYFPLPMTFDEKNSVIEASNGITLAYTSKYLVQGRQARNALKRTWRYAVQCSNLMSEAVEVLNEADDHMGALLAAVCDDCPKLGTEDCEECPPYKTLRKIGVLLAKLEGGADNERD